MSLESLEQALPQGNLLLLDTTTVISYFKGNEPASPVATQIVDGFIANGRNPAKASAVTAMELLVSPLRLRDEALLRQVTFFLQHFPNLTVESVDFATAQQAAALRATYNFKTPDALILATSRAHGVRYLVSNDEEWRRKLTRLPHRDLEVCYLEDHLPFP
ncbi:MAG TPA: PIN domain-containing protein [Chloroflexota bacterium]|nr:PIN domain-containing protein [Chloroflexota bacterium]